MIELTQEQVHTLTKSSAELPRVVNPETKESYVLVPLTEYLRLKEVESFDESPWTDEERSLIRQQACEMLDAFGKDK